MPSMEAMLMTLAGLAALAAARSGAASAFELRARIVDEDVELWFALLDFRSQHLDAGHGGNIDRQRDAFAGILSGELFRRRLASGRFPRGDVNFCRALIEKSGCDHLADAARSSGHHRDSVLKRKQILEHAFSPLVLIVSVAGVKKQLFPSPPVGEGGCDAKHRRRVRGLSPRMQTPHPSRTASAPPSPTRGEGKGS
jgi:hypothetical protein